jgi:hypothetical protein
MSFCFHKLDIFPEMEGKLRHFPLPTRVHTHTHIYIYTYVYIYMYVCVCVCVMFVDRIRLGCARYTSIRSGNSSGELAAQNNACNAIDTGNLKGRVQYEIDGTSLALQCACSHAACMGLNLTDARSVKPACRRIISAKYRPRLHKAAITVVAIKADEWSR